MTSTLAGPAARGAEGGDPGPEDGAPRRVEVTALDVLAGGALLVVALLAWAALALAHVGHHSVPAVLGVALGATALLGVLAARSGRVRVRGDLPGVVVALLCAGVAAALTFPGFTYGVSDKDPGGYVAHAAAISRTGGYSFVDPLLASGAPVQLLSPGARFAGVWVRGEKDADGSCGPEQDGCKIVPQFYHLWPALLATSFDVGDHPALFATVPVPGVLSVLLMVAVLRRVGDALLPAVVPPGLYGRAPPGSPGLTAGLAAGLAGGLLLATNMLQVWQARFPTTEVLAQSLYLGALLGIVVALQTGWRPAAGFAGLCVGIGFLNRADGVLLVVMAVGVGALLLAVRRWDGRAWWAAAGLGVVLPHALLQAYDLALFYSQANSVPSLELLVTLSIVLLAAGAGVGAVDALLVRRGRGGLVGLATSRRSQLVLGLTALLLACALLTLGFLRTRLFGQDTFDYLGREVRSFDEAILRRLAWFFTLPGFALMLAGLAVVCLRRWRASVWAVVLPTLVLFPLYAYSARNSTRLLWWTRRYVPTVLPGILILVALAIAFAVVYRYRGRLVLRVPGLLALAALVGVFLSQSLPLRSHDEWRGSTQVTAAVSALSPGETGLYLWEPNQGCCVGPTQLFATPVWLSEGELSTLLPGDAALRMQTIAAYRRTFPDMPIFVLGDKGELPAGIDPATVVPVERIPYALPMWEESDLERPDEPTTVTGEVSVWRVTGT